MVKKKVQTRENPAQTTPQDDTKEQLANLKALNNLLVRETVERREHIDTLKRSKEALESELSRSIADAQRLENEKSTCQDRIAASEIEQALSVLVIASELGKRGEEWRKKIAGAEKMAAAEAEKKSAMTQMVKSMEREREELMTQIAVSDAKIAESFREKEEIERGMEEKEIRIRELQKVVDRVREDLDLHKEDAGRLRLMVMELEKSNAEGREESRRLQMQCDGLVEEKMEMGTRYESLLEDRNSVQRRLVESLQQFNDLKKEFQDTVNTIDTIKRSQAEQDVEMNELQKEVGLLESELRRGKDALDSALRERDALRTELGQQEEETRGLISKVLELEKSNSAVQEELGHLRMEQDRLVGEKEERETTLESLMKEKISIERNLMESLQCIEDLKRKMEETVRDKDEIEQVRIAQEVDITQLQEEVGRLNATVSSLEQSCGNLREVNRQLGFDLSHQKDAIEHVLLEKRGILQDLNGQKQEAQSLKMQVLELERSNEETVDELAQIRIERDGLLEEKKETDRRFELLTEDRNSMEKHLVDTREGLDNLQTRMKLAEILSGRTLSMLKDTAEMVGELENGEKVRKVENAIDTEETEGDIQPFALQLAAIKRAFEMRVRMAEDARKELSSLQMSIAELQKKKNLWTWLSSITTIFAAASIAFIARGGGGH